MRILVLDDDLYRIKTFNKKFKEHEITCSTEVLKLVSIMERNEKFDLICLDHDLGELVKEYLVPPTYWTGLDAVKKIIELKDKYPRHIIIHSWNPTGAIQMLDLLEKAGINCSACPFNCDELFLVIKKLAEKFNEDAGKNSGHNDSCEESV